MTVNLQTEPAEGARRRALTRRAASMLAMLIIASVTIIPDLHAAHTRATCYTWSLRTIDLRPITFEQIASGADTQMVITVPEMPLWIGGAALPGVTLVAQDAGPTLWIHEQVHQIQMQQDGHFTFLTNYITDWYRGRFAGCGAFDAYQAIGYEREAGRYEWIYHQAAQPPGVPTSCRLSTDERPPLPCLLATN